MRILSAVRLSVCLSVKRVMCDKMKEICAHILTTRKTIYPSFVRSRMVGGGRPLLPEILGQPAPVGAKSPIFNRYSLVAPHRISIENRRFRSNRVSLA